MTDNSDSILTHLGRPAYLLAALLVVLPFADFVNNAWPLNADSVAWRYAGEGLFSGSLLTLALGMLLAGAVALGRGERAAILLLEVTAWVGTIGCVVVAIDFVLSVLQMRVGMTQDPAALGSYDLGGVRVTVKYVATAAFFAWLGLAMGRRRRGQRKRPAGEAPPMLIHPMGETRREPPQT